MTSTGSLSAVWMFAGTVLVMFGTVSEVLGGVIFPIPIALNEMVLAIWLILKGFDRTEMSADRDRRFAMSS